MLLLGCSAAIASHIAFLCFPSIMSDFCGLRRSLCDDLIGFDEKIQLKEQQKANIDHELMELRAARSECERRLQELDSPKKPKKRRHTDDVEPSNVDVARAARGATGDAVGDRPIVRMRLAAADREV